MKMAAGSTGIRRGQLISPFGVGSILVTPDAVSMIGAGLDHWYETDGFAASPADVDVEEFRVEEWRLQRMLGVSHLRLPPDFRRVEKRNPEPNQGLRVPYLRFPTWHRCRRCNLLTRLPLSMRGRPMCQRCAAGWKETEPRRNVRLYQVSNVAVCDYGHIEDFPYLEWVHRTTQPTCSGPLILFATGAATAANEKVKCEGCGKERTMAGALQGGSEHTYLSQNLAGGDEEYLCTGRAPWHGDAEPSSCGRQLRGALRGASNVYFPLVMTSIYLPREAESDVPEELLQILERPPVSTFIHALHQAGADIAVDQVRNMSFLLLRSYTDRQIEIGIQTITSPPDIATVADQSVAAQSDFRREEFDVLMTPRESPQLVVRPSPVDGYGEIVGSLFERVHLVDRLRETRALWGLNRLLSETPFGPQDRRQLLWRQYPPDQQAWLPAYVVYGEGLFLELRGNLIREWEQSEAVQGRIGQLSTRFQAIQAERGRSGQPVTPRLVLVHTLSHLLMNALAFSSGYSAASIRERLFVSHDVERPMAALLIYTADGDSEGTLGGLVRLGKPGSLEVIVADGLEQARWCSGDPVCMEIGGRSGQGPDSCNLAACYRCALVAETSCELQNRFLDRATLIGVGEGEIAEWIGDAVTST
jgi:hypothetical protein